uniref:Bestrophin homolog n=1 Tax=Ascaris lumbricoides TaxID=6252 RepID=A0A0M3IXG8_ASCLU
MISTAIYTLRVNRSVYYQEPRDPIMGHIILPINSMYNQLITTILLGEYYRDRNLNDVIPDSIEEEYSILAHK